MKLDRRGFLAAVMAAIAPKDFRRFKAPPPLAMPRWYKKRALDAVGRSLRFREISKPDNFPVRRGRTIDFYRPANFGL